MQDPVAGWRLIISKLIGGIAQGFDEYEGIPYSNDMWITANRNPKRNYPSLQWMKGKQAVAHIPDAANQAVVTDAITDAAVKFINEHKNKPFFCYVPHSAVHYPFMVTPERLAAAKDDVMQALVSEIDASTGRVLDTLRKHGIDKDTLVLFTNDNGGAGKTSSGPLRVGKFGPKYGGAHAGLNPRLVARQNSRRISFLGDHGHHRPAADHLQTGWSTGANGPHHRWS